MKKKIAIGLALLVAVCGVIVAQGVCYNYYYRNGNSNGISVTTEDFTRMEDGKRISGTTIRVSSNVERRIRITSTNFGQGERDEFSSFGTKEYTVNKQIKRENIVIEAQTCD